jgi:hypothetical protein
MARAWMLLAAVLLCCGGETARDGGGETARDGGGGGGGAPPDDDTTEACDCSQDPCLSAEAEEASLCSSEDPEASVTRLTWGGCNLSAIVVTGHHYGATHVYDESGMLVGFAGGDGFSGWYSACGIVSPCAGLEPVRCVLCPAEAFPSPDPPCEP